jgi:hypothetical protein
LGEQVNKIRQGLGGALSELERKKIPLKLAAFLWKSVITPKALYALSVTG